MTNLLTKKNTEHVDFQPSKIRWTPAPPPPHPPPCHILYFEYRLELKVSKVSTSERKTKSFNIQKLNVIVVTKKFLFLAYVTKLLQVITRQTSYAL